MGFAEKHNKLLLALVILLVIALVIFILGAFIPLIGGILAVTGVISLFGSSTTVTTS